MDSIQVKDFIKNEMESRWQKWSPSFKEVQDWILLLKTYPYKVAEEAIRLTFYASDLRPKASVFMEKVKLIANNYPDLFEKRAVEYDRTKVRLWVTNNETGHFFEVSEQTANKWVDLASRHENKKYYLQEGSFEYMTERRSNIQSLIKKTAYKAPQSTEIDEPISKADYEFSQAVQGDTNEFSQIGELDVFDF